MNIYQQLTKNQVTRIVCTLVLVSLAVLLESKIKLISPKASLFGFYPIVLASYLFFHSISTAIFAGLALQYFIINDKSFAINWSQDIWVHAFIGLGCYCLYRIKNHLDQKTELLEKKLKEEEDNKFKFTQNLGTFIKNHTRIIKQGGHFMQVNPPTHEKYQKGLNLLIAKTNELDSLADDILNVSLFSSEGKLEFPKNVSSFKSLAVEVIAEFEKSHPNKIEFDYDGHSVNALWNEDAIKRMLRILCANAIEHGDAEIIKIHFKENDKMINCSFKNSGAPIAFKDPQLVFRSFNKMFSQLNEGTKPALNLTLAKAIAEAHGGNIKVISNSVEGTLFQVFMPRRIEQQSEQE